MDLQTKIESGRRDLESGDGLFEGKRGLSALLCTSAGIAASGDEKSVLSQRVSDNFT